MDALPMTPITSSEGTSHFKNGAAEIVEIALLLPTSRVEALIALSKRRKQSVGQILRQLIDTALRDEL